MSLQTYNSFRKINHTGSHFEEELFFSSLPRNSLLHIYSFGDSVFKGGAKLPVCSSEWVFQLILDGKGFFVTPEEKIPLRAGCVCLMHPMVKYQFIVQKESYLKKQFFGIANNVISSGIMSLGEISNQTFFSPASTVPFQNFFREVKALIQKDGPQVHFQLSTLAYAFFEQFKNLENAHAGQNSMDRILRNCLFDLNKKHTLESLAKAFGTSKRSLNRMFLERYQCPPVEYIIRHRMEYAKQLLLINTLFVQDIARECGYSSPTLFVQEFKKRFGMTPRQYQNGNWRHDS